ncbi:nucleotidyltransferase family protein [Flavihumibacter rivuli]|uniref:nucleotidyltransferase family protein n=1 Tax=Flavihumibacter rivuli TaxID=2838156 RepID=UPI001BDEA7EC|nr:nucleotidyltransferase family protein [Flavihumibacter rivuli]ULQ54870.1 nucleotidyltransferase family protein [Flavihumibacter rivuli]
MKPVNQHSIHCAIVILAAGQSSRLGEAKQLLPYKGKSLLAQAVDTALATSIRPVVVVLGARNEAVAGELEGKEVVTALNAAWEEGMGSSLRCGLEKARSVAPETDAVIFMVCDQPYVTSDLLLQLVHTQESTLKPIVASSYGDQSGTPALFSSKIFPALLEIKGDTGARKLIRQYADEVATIPFPEGIIDIDTPSDYETLM